MMLIRRRMIQNLMLDGLMYHTRISTQYRVSSSSKIAKMKFSYFYTWKIYFINEILV